MRQRVRRDLMALIDAANLTDTGLDVLYRNTLAQQRAGRAQQAAVQVEGALEPVFVKYSDQSLILGHRVVIAEGDRFHFALKHVILSFCDVLNHYSASIHPCQFDVEVQYIGNTRE